MNIRRKAGAIALSATLLSALVATLAAPLVSATTTTTSAGTIGRGQTSTTTASFQFTETAAGTIAAGGTILVSILDSANNPTVHFVGGSVVLAAPGSLGASLSLADASFLVTTTSFDGNQEQITVSGLKIKADAGAALGAIKANVVYTGGLLGAFTPTTVTASGILQTNVVGAPLQVGLLITVTSTCNFVITGAGAPAAGNATFSDYPLFPAATDGRAVTAISGTPTSTGTQTIDFGAGTASHPINTIVTQTVANCNTTTLGSPGTVGDVVIENVTPTPVPTVRPGENNQGASNVTLTEQTAGYLANPTALTFTLSVGQYSVPPTVAATTSAGGLAVGGFCNLSFDRKSCTVSTSGKSTTGTGGVITVSNIFVDIDASVAIGTPVNVTVTGSPAINVTVTANTIANVGRVIVGVAAQPTIFINYNDQSTGQISLTESAAGYFKGGTGSNNQFMLCYTTGETYTRAPWAVVTVGNLLLLSGLVGAATVRGSLSAGNTCATWTVYSKSTAASTIEIRGSDASDVVLPSGPLNGPRLSVMPPSAPGSSQAMLSVGDFVTPVVSSTTLVSNAIRAFKSGVVVTAASQPRCAPGSTDCLAGNLVITETLNGQFKPGQNVCIQIQPRTSNEWIQDTWFDSATQNSLPIPTTNAASGLLVGPVGVGGNSPGCTGIGDNRGAAGFTVTQQSFGPALGQITISNIHLIIAADAPLGNVLVRVFNKPGDPGVQFSTFVSNALIGNPPAPTSIVNLSAVGVTKTGPFSTGTKVTPSGTYVTWQATMSPSAAGETVGVWVATNTGAGWSVFARLTSRKVGADGKAYFFWKSATSQRVSVRFSFDGNGSHAATHSLAMQANYTP